jgi:hypothetical protein
MMKSSARALWLMALWSFPTLAGGAEREAVLRVGLTVRLRTLEPLAPALPGEKLRGRLVGITVRF